MADLEINEPWPWRIHVYWYCLLYLLTSLCAHVHIGDANDDTSCRNWLESTAQLFTEPYVFASQLC